MGEWILWFLIFHKDISNSSGLQQTTGREDLVNSGEPF